jgi:hypothetical protein
LRVSKRTVAVSNDVEVPEVKIGREPRINHEFYYVGNRSGRGCKGTAGWDHPTILKFDHSWAQGQIVKNEQLAR